MKKNMIILIKNRKLNKSLIYFNFFPLHYSFFFYNGLVYKMIFLLLLLVVSFCYADFRPTGRYCGSIIGMISITARVKTETVIDLGITVFGKSFNCMDEQVLLLPNNTISFPNANSRQNCIYRILDEFGKVDLRFNYDSRRNIVFVQISSMGTVRMEHC